ncbi:MAG: protein translocase subunit SecD [Bdellovibrionota bacterium]
MKNPMPILWWTKCIFILVAILFGLSYSAPTFLGNPAQWPKNDDGSYKSLVHTLAKNVLPASRINLGLDLKGGLSLTLNVEINNAVKQSVSRSISRAKEILAQKGIKTGNFEVKDDYSVEAQMEDSSKIQDFQKAILEQTTLLLFKKSTDHSLFFQGNTSLIQSFEVQIMQQAINTIRNRIDQFGVAEPNIFQAGNTRIVVELPGLTDIEHAKQLLGNTAQLDFRMVLNQVPQEKLQPLLDEAKMSLNIEANNITPATIEKLAQWLRDNGKIQPNATIMLHRVVGQGENLGKTLNTVPYLVELHSILTGDMIEDAQAEQSTENYTPAYAVSLKFKPQGAKLFADLTTNAFKPENAPHQIAIILDQDVYSAPSINDGPILGGSARITMGRSNNLELQMKDAQDLALVLRAGALPASVKVVEERQIGPSEGAQNIHAGVISSVIAAILVVVLMLFIYGLSGVVANIAMFFNILLILAFMALFGATLTLPGIAGIVLTMAIAVDGNVVINERIREEIRSGLTQKQAFYKGYSTSFRTLIDAHITSAVAGLVLVVYGNPTVKGFAVTLLCGIICTLFTSYYVTQVIGQWLIEKTNLKRFG